MMSLVEQHHWWSEQFSQIPNYYTLVGEVDKSGLIMHTGQEMIIQLMVTKVF